MAEMTIAERMAACRIFREGTSAFYDTLFSGMVPCKVIAVHEASYGFMVATDRQALTIRVTADHGPYKRGEEIYTNAYNVVPVKMRKLRDYQYRILTNYCYLPKGQTHDDRTGSSARTTSTARRVFHD